MCWRQERSKRPTVSYTLRSLRKAANLDSDDMSPLMGFGVRERSDSGTSASSFSSTFFLASNKLFYSLNKVVEQNPAHTRGRKI